MIFASISGMDGFSTPMYLVAGLLVALAATPPKQARRAIDTPPPISGCYRVDKAEWSRPLGPDAGYHVIPAVIRLDTVPEAREGWRVSPDIAFPAPSEEKWVPRWTATADSVEIVWSNGYLVTKLELQRSGVSELRGEAIAESDESDDGVAFPHAPVVARRIACAALD